MAFLAWFGFVVLLLVLLVALPRTTLVVAGFAYTCYLKIPFFGYSDTGSLLIGIILMAVVLMGVIFSLIWDVKNFRGSLESFFSDD
ncbi:MAG: hypothetical protein Q8O83_03855 [bacterium]|nr:hypothetical protein [bacterium]